MTINFNSPIPYYVQLIDDLRNKIERGVWKPGDKLPGEHGLCETYGVSRSVVRQALRELELEGLIYRRKARGSFVAEAKISEKSAQQLSGFYQEIVERGQTLRSQVLKLGVESAGGKVAEYLEIDIGSNVIELQRLLSVNGEPLILESVYLSCELCPGLEHLNMTDVSLQTILKDQFSIISERGWRIFEAVVADEREAKLLQIDVGAPLLLFNSVTYRADGTAIEYSHAVHRGDRSRFKVDLIRVQKKLKGGKREAET